jgi:hypothetical protein
MVGSGKFLTLSYGPISQNGKELPRARRVQTGAKALTMSLEGCRDDWEPAVSFFTICWFSGAFNSIGKEVT